MSIHRSNIPLIIAAKNEERSIAACLRSAQRAAAFVARARPVHISIVVVCDDCADATEKKAKAAGAKTVRSSGGKIAAQTLGASTPAPYYLFCDADVVLSEDALLALCEVMETQPQILATSVPRVPVRPQSRGLIAQAAYVYNLRRGFRARVPWISGRLFAVRQYDVPVLRPPRSRDRFLALETGLLAEDIYLSGRAIGEGGFLCLCETERGAVYFRPPETLRGIYRYYRRLRRELARTRALCPQFTRTIVDRGTDESAIAAAPVSERAYFVLFSAVIRGCEFLFTVDRAYHRYILRQSGVAWPVVPETKSPIADEEIPVD